MSRALRANPVALARFGTYFNFEPICFDTADETGLPICHTNVMISVATALALVGLDLAVDASLREKPYQRFTETVYSGIALENSQSASFADNALGRNARVLALSWRSCTA